MRGSEAGRRRSAADGSGAPGPPQRGRSALALGAVLLAGWTALACAQGGIDVGELAGPGPTGAFLALLAGAPAAAWALWRARRAPSLRSGPARLALGGLCGLAIWTAASIAWARAPDLAWIELNRTLLALAALVAGLALGSLLPRAPERLALGLGLAALPVVGWALASKTLPTLLGADGDPGRLETPLGYSNALALAAVFAVPGALWLAARPGAPRWAPPVGAAWTCALLVTLLLTYSRGGLIALAVALAAVLTLAPWRLGAALTALAAALGAILPAAYGLTAGRLTADGLLAAERRGAGLGLGWRLAVGMALAAALGLAGRRLAARLDGRVRLPSPRRRGAIAAVAGCVVVALGAGAVAAGQQSGLGNDPGHLFSLDSNHRIAWWGEALRAFADEPLAGSGAGSFPLLHLQERRDGLDLLNVRQPHQLALQLGAELGVVGLALMGAAIAGIAWGARRAASAAGGGAVALPVAIAAAFLAQSQLDWTWSVPALTVAAMAAGGVLLATGGAPAEPAGRPAPRARAGGAALGLAAAAAAASALLPWWSGEQTAAGWAAFSDGQGRAALARADEARRLNPLALAPLQLRAAALRATGDPAGELAALRQAARAQPDNPRPWRDLATALVRQRRPGATEAWAQVLRLDPHAPPAPPAA